MKENGSMPQVKKQENGKKIYSITLLMIVMVLYCYPVSAQGPGGRYSTGGGWGANAQYNRVFNPTTIETLSGTIIEVRSVIPITGMSQGVHLLLKTEKEEIVIHVGPDWYMSSVGIKFSVNDAVVIRGSRIKFNNLDVIIAVEIVRGDFFLRLRDYSGFPIWGGWRRR